ncbi:MAG: SRPBCC family protein [Christiangramia sp.]|nr:SRPBCC family protein [Christiangramia sp.]
MKTLKSIGIVVLAFVVLLLIVALFVSRDFHYEKSITIDRPIGEVWEHTNSLAALDEWSPWNEFDPNMKKEMTGVDGTVGAMSSWESDHEKVGKGSQTISKVEAPRLLATDLKFYTPYESEAKGYVKLDEAGNSTVVTWGFDSEMPYPFNLMKLTMDMEEEVGKDFEMGLQKLKRIAEEE